MDDEKKRILYIKKLNRALELTDKALGDRCLMVLKSGKTYNGEAFKEIVNNICCLPMHWQLSYNQRLVLAKFLISNGFGRKMK